MDRPSNMLPHLIDIGAAGPVHMLPTSRRVPRAIAHQKMEAHWLGPPMYNPASLSPFQVAMNLIRFDQEGEPFFTKEFLREMQAQLARPLQSGERYTSIGVDGTPVEFEPAFGQVSNHMEFQYVNGPVRLVYVPWNILITQACSESSLNPASYCRVLPMHVKQYLYPGTGEIMQLPPINPEIILDLLEEAINDWETSNAWTTVKETLIAVRSRHTIDNLVAFSCGSIFGEFAAGIQHAMLLLIMNLFGVGGGDGLCEELLACSVQDPNYKEWDKETLMALDMKVVDDPQGFLDVEDESIVFTCASDVPVKEIVLEIARPAIIIWEDITRINS
ncbi:uncharacterized protein BO97DRAFT_413415 [Aspergillus homomorphus CBS 101889]|uniref:SRR1-like domain-containing protein n=1 Tax=Aspergillus homomorphus (strain CBS 101889) TaxID=1450537 RepID=A0A395I1D3_ASPHC|nr:hypothetical protein BO97DRAFT_413415 [Aspergillus homomorphus CBS 101889]RAL13433.1 hypothetical protein BO97DRAFT_413415 [Aspergillus homomorphus CBS 101889]